MYTGIYNPDSAQTKAMWANMLLSSMSLLLLAMAGCDCSPVGVRTSVGDIMGFSDNVNVDGQTNPLTKFLGIPYAEPPVGEHRFNKPVPKRSFNETYNATTYPTSCYQTGGRDFKSFSEDCLFLNIFVPGLFDLNTSFPVMVWIHGGAFRSGTSSSFKADVLSTFGNVVVVTLNYRLGTLGFLRNSDGTLIGNQGLWDQQLAIQWVKDNIQHFHGNPDEISIFGESAGSISVIAHTLYAGNKGLFKRAIAQSGSVFEGIASKSPNADIILKQTGCAASTDPISCLRMKPVEELIDVKAPYGPSIDGTFLVDFPEIIVTGSSQITAAAREFFGEVDILTGVNSADGAYQMAYYWPEVLGEKDYNTMTINRTQFLNVVIPKAIGYLKVNDPQIVSVLEKFLTFEYTDWSDPYNMTTIRRNVMDLSSDSLFYRAMARTVREHRKLKRGSTYMYELAISPSSHLIKTPDWIKGTAHADDIIYIFGEPLSDLLLQRVNFTDDEKHVARAMMTAWTNFATTGNPNAPTDVTQYFGTKWPQYYMDTQSYLKITDQLSEAPVQHGFYPKRMTLWLDLFHEIIKAHN